MKSISVALKNHLAEANITMCLCFNIVRPDGVGYYFVGHDRDLVIDTHTYRADLGFSASEADSKYGLSVDNCELTIPLSEEGVTKADVLSGVFYKSKLDVFWVNWPDLTMGKMYEAKGWLLGKVTVKEYRAVFVVRSLASYLDATVVDTIAPSCPYIFGLDDGYRSRCPLNLDTYKSSGAVTAVTDKRTFTGSVSGTSYSNGRITFTSGNNTGYSMEIETAETDVVLFMELPFEIQVDDAYDIWYGCNKSFAACQTFGVQMYFGGEPNVPSKDMALQYAVS